MGYKETKKLLADQVDSIGCEMVPLEQAYGRILGEDMTAGENVPCFARSPYDGYAFCAADSSECGNGRTVSLAVIDQISAGEVSPKTVVRGTAIRLMTGASLPEGADAICKYEETDYTENSVTLHKVYRSGENVVAVGEDIKEGTLLARRGTVIDPGLIGTFASLGICEVKVHRRLKVGILTTGDEVIKIDKILTSGKIRNSNLYAMQAVLARAGMDTVYIGHASDDVDDLCKWIETGEKECDVIVSTGGVSMGDYDLVPDAMSWSGYTILAQGVEIKPGMACAYGWKGGRIMLALSGNPASALTNLECVCMPALKKMAGYAEYDHKVFRAVLKEKYEKGAKGTRLLRGRLEYGDNGLTFIAAHKQENNVLSSFIGVNAYGMIVDCKDPIPAGYSIEVFVI